MEISKVAKDTVRTGFAPQNHSRKLAIIDDPSVRHVALVVNRIYA
jgi:hypothetical protein